MANYNSPNNGGSNAMTWIIIILFIVGAIGSCSGGSSNSSYQLHNKDGSLNYEYVQDLWEWQAKQKKK